MSLGLVESFNAPVYLPAYVVTAKITNLARRFIARGSWDGTVTKVTDFSVGRGGYDPVDYTKALPVDLDAPALDDPVFTAAITKLEWANPSCSSYYCLVQKLDVSACLGEIGIWSVVVASPVAGEVGTTFLSAIGHFPLRAKNAGMDLALRVLRQS